MSIAVRDIERFTNDENFKKKITRGWSEYKRSRSHDEGELVLISKEDWIELWKPWYGHPLWKVLRCYRKEPGPVTTRNIEIKPNDSRYELGDYRDWQANVPKTSLSYLKGTIFYSENCNL